MVTNQRVVLAVASSILVLLMAGAALRVRYALADRHYKVAQRVQGRDQIRHLEQTLDLDPGRSAARIQLARDLMALGQYHRALTQLGLLIHMGAGLKPGQSIDLWELREDQGEALYHLQQFAEAAVSLQSAILLRPQASVSHLFLARALESQGQTPAAIREFHAAIQDAPGDEQAYMDLASLLLSTGQKTEGDQLAREMTAASPQLAMDWSLVEMNRAIQAQRLPDALAEARKAAAADPESDRPLLSQASLLVRLGQPSEAVAASQLALKSAPADPAARLTFAGALEADQQWDRAVKAYQSLEKAQPRAFEGWVASGQGPRPDNPAAVLWQEHLESTINPGDVHLMGPDSEPGIQQAWYAGDEGVHRINANTANALFLQGALAQARRDYTGAGQFFENAMHFLPPAESNHNTPFTNGLREAIEEGIDSILAAQISIVPGANRAELR